MSLLEIKNLHANVGGNEILKGIDLTVNPGEVHSIMGPNGSGKSTLAQVLARRESYEVTKGEILFNGKDLLAMKPEDAACTRCVSPATSLVRLSMLLPENG